MSNVIGITDMKHLKEVDTALSHFEDAVDAVAYSKMSSQAKDYFLTKTLTKLVILKANIESLQERIKNE